METYLNASQEAGKQFYLNFRQKGEVVMLNLLKFREVADYSAVTNLRPAEPISGEAAYELYMKHTQPLFESIGSTILFYGASQHFLIGPEAESWDAVLLVAHPSAEQFIAFSQNPEYLQNAGHRTAALLDSRLLPTLRKTE